MSSSRDRTDRMWRLATATAMIAATGALVFALLAWREARRRDPPTYGEISAAAVRTLQAGMHGPDGMTPHDVMAVLGAPTEVFRDNPRALCWRYETPYEIRMCWGPKRRRAWIAHNIPFELLGLDFPNGRNGSAAPRDRRSIRKQVGDLTTTDLDRFPIWEFALDEEARQGQDEETVRPRPDLRIADPHEGLLIARASFRAADGRRYVGYVYPSIERDIGFVQPTIVTARGQVNFWYGLMKPSRDDLDRSYRAVDATPESLFPLKYSVAVPARGAPLRGEIDGFMYRTGPDDDSVREVRR